MEKPSVILKVVYGYLKVFVYDTYRFVRHSGTLRTRTHAPSRGALMTKYYHMVEKGLALPQPRPGFGLEVTADLARQMRAAVEDGVCQREIALSADALDSYAAFNERNAASTNESVVSILDHVRGLGISPTGGATKVPPRAGNAESHLEFLRSRVSVRKFSAEAVPHEVLLEAVRAAQYAPCVCNRQAARVYFLTGTDEKARALHFQNGNRGFGSDAPVIAIITVDLAELIEPTERYQHWIDGGLFAENFLLAIHAQGYGACALNWSAPIKKDIGIRKLGYIPASESIIMMVAIGAVDETASVARSERRPLADVVKFISPVSS